MSIKEQALAIKAQNPHLGYRSIAAIIGCAHNSVKYYLRAGDRETMHLRNMARRERLRIESKIQAGGKCIQCGYNRYPQILEFHHRDPSQKTATLGTLFSKGVGPKTLAKELAKCDLLCPNCHKEAHIKLDEIKKNLIRHWCNWEHKGFQTP